MISSRIADHLANKYAREYKINHKNRPECDLKYALVCFSWLGNSFLFEQSFYHAAMGFVLIILVVGRADEQDLSRIAFQGLGVMPVFDLPDRGSGGSVIF